ncbi:MAG: tetratricopeptide repeat protein [Pseudomonadota bacterium]|nr:tetratricopeptide repeat protein [Pseudomonadota bacterium]
MPETADPLAALSAKDLATRAAGARDLAATGTPEHLTTLVQRAVSDPSPGVRLGAAAAAADILSRWRLAPRAAEIPDAARAALWATIKATDPGVNAGIFQVCATLNVPDATSRILGAMRDPRVDVRLGACVGLLRLCASAAVNGDTGLEARVVALFDDPRVKPDTQAEIARVCSVVGYTSSLDAVRKLAENGLRLIATVAGEAQQRLEWPASFAGMWADLGVDAGGMDEGATPGAVIALTSAQPNGAQVMIRGTEAGVKKVPLTGAPRRLWLKRPGATEPTWALQIGAVTYWAAEDDEIITFGDNLLAAEAFSLFAQVEPFLPLNAATARLRGAAKLRAGDALGSLEYFAAAIEMKKAPADAWWYFADALHRLGRDEEARPHLEKFLAKAPKRAPFVIEAKKRLEA